MMLAIKKKRRLLIPGPILVGFSEFFDNAYGSSKTPKDANGDYPTVTPSRLGPVLLPFVCIYCESVQSVEPRQVANYTDNERGFSWCPSCRGRYVLDTDGQPLEDEIPPGVNYAPATVERGNETTIVGRASRDALSLLGVV